MYGFCNMRLTAFFLSFCLAAWATSTTAQSYQFGPKYSAANGGSIIITISSLPSATTGDATLNVTYFGDLGPPQGAQEYIDVTVDGTLIGTLHGGVQCHSPVNDTLTIPEAVLDTAVADGVMEIVFDASTAVGSFCAAPPPFTRNELSAFGVSGTMNLTTAAPPPPATGATADILGNRAVMITGSAPDTTRRIDRLEGGTGVIAGGLSFAGLPLLSALPVDVQVTRSGAQFATALDLGGPVLWSEGRYVRFNDSRSSDGTFAIFHLGADWTMGPDLMLGIAGQIDAFDQTETATGDQFSGLGYMIGPVVTARLTDGLFLDVRLAYGTAENEIARVAGTDEFSSRRALAELALLGEISFGDYIAYPEVELIYFREVAEAYSSVAVGAVPAGLVSLSQARLGVMVERNFDLPLGQELTGFADMRAAFTGIDAGNISAGSYANEIEGWSGEVGFGLRYETDDGVSMDIRLGAAGLMTDAESYSASLNLRIPLQ